MMSILFFFTKAPIILLMMFSSGFLLSLKTIASPLSLRGSVFQDHSFPCENNEELLKQWLQRKKIKPKKNQDFKDFFQDVQKTLRQEKNNFPPCFCSSEVCLLINLRHIYSHDFL